jgi:hypothetical protein
MFRGPPNCIADDIATVVGVRLSEEVASDPKAPILELNCKNSIS